MKVAGIIINYRTAELTVTATTALLKELRTLPSAHLYVVDNDSGDGSLDHLRAAAQTEGWGNDVTVIAAPKNGGYGYGINVGVQHGLALRDPPDYFYVLNSDAFADPGSVGKMVDYLDAHPGTGVAGSEIHGTEGQTQATAFRFLSVFSELEDKARIGLVSRLLAPWITSLPKPAESTEVDWIPGTSMLIRRRVLEEVGLFDESFFLYFEEIDFCRRVRNAGWAVSYVHEAAITHIGSVSTKLGEERRRIPGYWFESRHRYFLKHHGVLYAAAADAAWIAGHLLCRTKERVLRRPGDHSPHLFRDFVSASLLHLSSPRAFLR